MGFHEVQFPTGISYGSRGGPGFNTKILELDSGAEERVSRWASARRRYNAGESVKKLTDLYDIQAFYIARQGPAWGFRYKDWLDYATTVDGRTPAANGTASVSHQDQTIGTGDGTATQFQLIKVYTSGSTTRTRNIQKPVAGTTVVAFGTSQQLTGWTVDTTTGIITFTAAPAAATIIRAGCEFDVPVRFGDEIDESFQASIEGFDNGDIPDIPIVEIFDQNGPDEEFYYGGAFRFGTMAANVTIALANGRVQSFSPNTTGLKLFLPSADNLPPGGPYLFVINEGSQTVALKTSDDVLVGNIATSTTAVVILSLNSSMVKTWYMF